MDVGHASSSSSSPAPSAISSDVKRPDKVHPYRVNFWADIINDDNTSEIMNVFAMILSMVGILLKYKTCAWFGVLVSAVSYTNIRSNYDPKQVMSTFMLSLSSVIMCYLTNAQPLSVYMNQQAAASAAASNSPLSSPNLATGDAATAGQ